MANMVQGFLDTTRLVDGKNRRVDPGAAAGRE
jgi:hypothetical protein